MRFVHWSIPEAHLSQPVTADLETSRPGTLGRAAEVRTGDDKVMWLLIFHKRFYTCQIVANVTFSGWWSDTWPLQRLSDLQRSGIKRSRLESPGSWNSLNVTKSCDVFLTVVRIVMSKWAAGMTIFHTSKRGGWVLLSQIWYSFGSFGWFLDLHSST